MSNFYQCLPSNGEVYEDQTMYEYWMREAGSWLPRVDECYSKGFLYREMNVYLKRALQCFMVEECV